MFTERPARQRIEYMGPSPVRRKICPGDIVSLRYGEASVLVRKVTPREPYGYSGQIYGFDPNVQEFGALKVGDHVEFGERHVQLCSHFA